ncbi:type II toxin-antitoxin system RelE/ParE family toxin [Labrenzia suaedae]|uniref:Type II toxin-antitoxin system RelE/ParE family toxin n=2 Tax=Roseibium litorale TaxID=2803841 RepID=A0ABR9CRQ9_9HYPH|nr:type II toxin-antitoxin system RelE/ParE family toxin [Roseibium litorale]
MPLEWSSEAERDVANIVGYIRDRNPQAAHKILDLIDEKAARLPINPKMCRKGRMPGTREMLVTPSYVLIYEESSAGVRVLRVLHTAQMWP